MKIKTRRGKLPSYIGAVFVFFVLDSCFCFSQININGFGYLKESPAAKNYSRFYPIEFNDDSHIDLAFFGSNKNSLYTAQGFDARYFSEGTESQLKFSIDELRSYRDKNLKNFAYAFFSRKDRLVGTIGFSKTGFPKVFTKIKTAFPPSKIDAADIDNDGFDEILISGPSYGGFSVFFQKEKELIEKKYYTDKSFSEAIFIDFNYDYFPDIVAFDPISNTINFFYNNRRNDFIFLKSLQLNSQIENLSAFDFNRDGYLDLVFTSPFFLHALFGDGSSDFKNELKVKLAFSPSKFIVSDFNNDGFNDIAYLNRSLNSVFVAFSKSNLEFNHEIEIFYNPELNDILLMKEKKAPVLLALSSRGSVFAIYRSSGERSGSSFLFSRKPDIFFPVERENNAAADFVFVDNDKQELIYIERNDFGTPMTRISIPLFEKKTGCRLLIDKSGENSFICYSSESRLIEIISFDKNKKKFERNIFYTKKPPRDIYLLKSGDFRVICVAGILNESLYIEFFFFNGKISREIEPVSGKIRDALFFLDESICAICVSAEENNISVYKISFDANLNFTDSSLLAKFPFLSNGITSYIYNSNKISGFIIESDVSTLSLILDKKSLICYRFDKSKKMAIRDKPILFSVISGDPNNRAVFFEPEFGELNILSARNQTVLKKYYIGDKISSLYAKYKDNDSFTVYFLDLNFNCLSIIDLEL